MVVGVRVLDKEKSDGREQEDEDAQDGKRLRRIVQNPIWLSS